MSKTLKQINLIHIAVFIILIFTPRTITIYMKENSVKVDKQLKQEVEVLAHDVGLLEEDFEKFMNENPKQNPKEVDWGEGYIDAAKYAYRDTYIVFSPIRTPYRNEGITINREREVKSIEIETQYFIDFLNQIPLETIEQTYGLKVIGERQIYGDDNDESAAGYGYFNIIDLFFTDELRSNWRKWEVEDIDYIINIGEGYGWMVEKMNL